MNVRKAPAAGVDSVAVTRTACDFLQQGEACQAWYSDPVVAPVGIAAKTSPSDLVQFQFFHEIVPENANRSFPQNRITCSRKG